MGSEQLTLSGEKPTRPRRVCTISPCGQYRYELGELHDRSGPIAVWCMCNPSTADAVDDDHTVRKVREFSLRMFAHRESYGGWVIVNPYALRSKKPRALLSVEDPTGPENPRFLRGWFSHSSRIIVGWGGALPKPLRGHASATVRLLAQQLGKELWCYGTTKDGQPQHPLTLAYATPLVPWESLDAG